MYYVLEEYNPIFDKISVVGVFNRSDISDGELEQHYGQFETIKTKMIHDSGIEWFKFIRCDCGEFSLALSSFELNEVG